MRLIVKLSLSCECKEFDMKNLKSTLFAGVLAASLAVPAFANEETVTTSLPQFTAADTQMLFEQDAAPMQLAALSPQEMKETEGAWLNFAVGGAIGLGTYAYNNWGNMTWGGALGSTALGAVGGFGAGVAGLRILGPYANTGGFGVALGRPGFNNWYGNANQFGRIDFHRNPHSSFIHTHRGGWGR
jgi:hypothetical protein